MSARAILLALAWTPLAAATELPIFDAHLHYSHDACSPRRARASRQRALRARARGMVAFLQTLREGGGSYERRAFPRDCR